MTAHGFKGQNQVLWSNATISIDWLLTYEIMQRPQLYLKRPGLDQASRIRSSNKVYRKPSIKHDPAIQWRGYSQLHCRADQPVAQSSLVAISWGHPVMGISLAWVVTVISWSALVVIVEVFGWRKQRQPWKFWKRPENLMVAPRTRAMMDSIADHLII